ncbi:hypothetical protein EIP86_007946 [Pleurotus ostreatoroseus]|nr:hypothetical protein EIP86_007946 [Pleurotus ostreatoroseus]
MATVLQFPAFPTPRHGILLNPSPGTSPYSHGHSLPGTPHLISSVSSLSSSASSNSPNTSDADTYFLTYASAKDTLSGSSSHPHGVPQPHEPALSRDNSRKHRPGSAPQTRRIRFAPLPEPRRDDLPEVFLNDSEENLAGFSYDSNPSSRASSRPSSLLLNGVVNLDNASSDSTPTLSLTNLNAHNRALGSPALPMSINTNGLGVERGDFDWDMCQPTSPSTTISSLEHFTQSCPASPASKRIDLPKEKSWSAKLLKPFRPRSGTAASRESDDGWSSGASTPARSGSRERGDIGSPLARYASSDNVHKHSAPKRSGLFHTNSTEDGLWRTQSGPGEIKRVKSREQEMEELRRVRSGSTSGYGPRKQLRMLNGRIYGAKRHHNNVNLFASARSEEPEFVEWGYGGMGSVKTAASVGADNKWSRVAGSSAFGGDEKRGRAAADDDDGSGVAWVRRRKEQREREKREKEAQEKAAQEQAAQAKDAEEAHIVEEPHADVADPDPPGASQMDEAVADDSKDEKEKEEAEVHVTQAVTVPASRSPHGHHRALTMERAPSIASVAASSAGGHVQLVRAGPERRGSADTARAASPPVSVHTLTERAISQLGEDSECEGVGRGRRESASSGGSSSNTESEEDEGDADTEESPKDEEEDEQEEEDKDMPRRTALSAGVEKISRHKEQAQSSS